MLQLMKRYSIAVSSFLGDRRNDFTKGFVILVAIIVVISVSGCSDPYEKCMKNEKRRNAYLGEEEYLQQSAVTCMAKVREAR
ncbi:hypothetical protein N2382_07930 [SAR92 clade bacterium H921]|nr:hypothetical protein [SAR92 clade bacterium H921]